MWLEKITPPFYCALIKSSQVYIGTMFFLRIKRMFTMGERNKKETEA